MDERIIRQEAIQILPTRTLRPEMILRVFVCYKDRFHIKFRYVPDRFYLPTGAFQQYLTTLSDEFWQDMNEVAFTILDDMNNQLVPKWLQVIIESDIDSVLIEDRQPQWQNPALLSRQVIF